MCMLGNLQQKKNTALENIYQISSSPQVLCDELSMQSTIKTEQKTGNLIATSMCKSKNPGQQKTLHWKISTEIPSTLGIN